MDLNHRPLGYEPNELPDCSTPHTYPNAGLSKAQDFESVVELSSSKRAPVWILPTVTPPATDVSPNSQLGNPLGIAPIVQTARWGRDPVTGVSGQPVGKMKGSHRKAAPHRLPCARGLYRLVMVIFPLSVAAEVTVSLGHRKGLDSPGKKPSWNSMSTWNARSCASPR